MLRRFTFPRGTGVRPGQTITVFVGRGTRRPGVFYWGQPRPVFENANGDGRDLGDGAYLFDPKGDLRAYMLYPCVVACDGPQPGRAGDRRAAAQPGDGHRAQQLRTRDRALRLPAGAGGHHVGVPRGGDGGAGRDLPGRRPLTGTTGATCSSTRAARCA